MQVAIKITVRSDERLDDCVPLLFLVKHLILRLPLRGNKVLALAYRPNVTLFDAGYRSGFRSYLNVYALGSKVVG